MSAVCSVGTFKSMKLCSVCAFRPVNTSNPQTLIKFSSSVIVKSINFQTGEKNTYFGYQTVMEIEKN